MNQATVVEDVTPGTWREACLRATADGSRFGGLFAAPGVPGELRLRAVFGGPDGARAVTCATRAGTIATLVDALPAAAWHEREIHDLHGLRFDGHEPLRPLLDHGAPDEAWMVPVHGRDVHDVAVGPIHAGVIESGHFRFHVVGERILHVDVRLFYKRRGLEQAAAWRPLGTALAWVQRACAACAVSNAVAYAHACESALGLEPDDALRRARTLLLELERAYNHAHDIGAICSGVGFAPGAMAYAALKERLQRLNARLTGHRFLFGAVQVGTSALAIDDHAAVARELRAIAAEHAALWHELRFVVSLQRRLTGVAVLTAHDAARLGAVGPAARAAGLADDVRRESPRLAYDGFAAAPPELATGDVAARTALRAVELEQSLGLLDDLLGRSIGAGSSRAAGSGGPLGVGRVEGPRGAGICVVERAGGTLRAVHLRTASYANWPVLAHTVPGCLLADFPLVNKSFELCYACVDR